MITHPLLLAFVSAAAETEPVDPLGQIAKVGADVANASLVLLTGGVIALILGLAARRALFRYWRDEVAVEIRAAGRWSGRVLAVLLGMLVALQWAGLSEDGTARSRQVLFIATAIVSAWFAQRILDGSIDSVLARVETRPLNDDIAHRRRRTQLLLIRRLGTVLITLLAISGVLLSFEGVRSLGASVLASAGVLGIIAGVAAQNSIRNLVAGIQIAFAEPIRLEDVVIVEGKWGWVEEITLTYVVVRVWDRRRMVLPTSWFVEHAFENWTRSNSNLLAEIYLHVDAAVPMEALRAESRRAVAASEWHDGDVIRFHVVDVDARSVRVRVIGSAAGGEEAWELKCEIREHLVSWLQREHPESLPRLRIEDVGREHLDVERRP